MLLYVHYFFLVGEEFFLIYPVAVPCEVAAITDITSLSSIVKGSILLVQGDTPIIVSFSISLCLLDFYACIQNPTGF